MLAIDTATSRASIALHDGHTVHGECTWEASNRHTVTLIPHIVDMLDAAGSAVAELAAVAVCIGPGSYTGVRIGVAVAKGIAMTQQIPLAGITTLDILTAAQPQDDRPMLALFAAGRRRTGYARYRWQEGGWHVESDVAIATWAELAAAITEPTLVVGEISSAGQELLGKTGHAILPQPAWHVRRAGYLADIAWARLRANEADDPATLMPLYAR